MKIMVTIVYYSRRCFRALRNHLFGLANDRYLYDFCKGESCVSSIIKNEKEWKELDVKDRLKKNFL